jgi:hypothetical protein
VLLRRGRGYSLFDCKVVAAYLAGSTGGALLTALVAWFLSGFGGPLGAAPRVVLLCAGAAFVWLVKRGPLGRFLSLPEARRQIPAEVFGGGLVRGAWRFGFELGTGVRTYVPSPAPYLVLLVVLLGHLTLGATLLIALGFGLARALPLVVQVSAAGREWLTGLFLSGGSQFAPDFATLLVFLGGLFLV